MPREGHDYVGAKVTLDVAPTSGAQAIIQVVADLEFIESCHKNGGKTPLYPLALDGSHSNADLHDATLSFPLVAFANDTRDKGMDPRIISTVNGAGSKYIEEAEKVYGPDPKNRDLVLNYAKSLFERDVKFVAWNKNTIHAKPKHPDDANVTGIVNAFIPDTKIHLYDDVRVVLPPVDDPHFFTRGSDFGVMNLNEQRIAFGLGKHDPVDFGASFVPTHVLSHIRAAIESPNHAKWDSLMGPIGDESIDHKTHRERALVRAVVKSDLSKVVGAVHAIFSDTTLKNKFTTATNADDLATELSQIFGLSNDNRTAINAGRSDTNKNHTRNVVSSMYPLNTKRRAELNDWQKTVSDGTFEGFRAYEAFHEDYRRCYVGKVVSLDNITRLAQIKLAN